MDNTEMALGCLRQTQHVNKAEDSPSPCPFLQSWRSSATWKTMKDSGWPFARLVPLGTGVFLSSAPVGLWNWNLNTVRDHLKQKWQSEKKSEKVSIQATPHEKYFLHVVCFQKPQTIQTRKVPDPLTIQTYQSLRKDQKELWRCQRWSQLWRTRCIMDGLKSERHKRENCRLIK